MKFQRYSDTNSFAGDVLEILLENEVQNNLPISFTNNKTDAVNNWLLASVKDDNGAVLLIAACTPPFNIVLYETRNMPNDEAVRLLSNELKAMGFKLPGVLAEQGLAERFALEYSAGAFHRRISMNIMRLDKVINSGGAPGFARPLNENDLFFAPYWRRAFGEECNVETYSVPENVERLTSKLGKDVHYIWEDSIPVSQAANSRFTVNGAVIGAVYTPPHYRGRGYATSVVAALSKILLERGNKFCALFADAQNPISCGIYRKIGFADQCVFDDIRFNKE